VLDISFYRYGIIPKLKVVSKSDDFFG
jgi:hypothetical protein